MVVSKAARPCGPFPEPDKTQWTLTTSPVVISDLLNISSLFICLCLRYYYYFFLLSFVFKRTHVNSLTCNNLVTVRRAWTLVCVDHLWSPRIYFGPTVSRMTYWKASRRSLRTCPLKWILRKTENGPERCHKATEKEGGGGRGRDPLLLSLICLYPYLCLLFASVNQFRMRLRLLSHNADPRPPRPSEALCVCVYRVCRSQGHGGARVSLMFLRVPCFSCRNL